VARFAARRVLAGLLTYTVIVAVTLAGIDGVCIALDLFPPKYRDGDAALGWRPALGTGQMVMNRCEEFSTGQILEYQRNEDGIRTSLSRKDAQSDARAKIAVTGDSQTDLCAPNAETHPGVLESELVAHAIPAVVLAFGAGKYSPLQEYLAFKQVVRPYHPQVLVFNVYTGNDFYDMLRVDDRPHFVAADSGYRIAPPRWFLYDEPGVKRRSRVLYAIRSVADRSGLRGLLVRGQLLSELAFRQGEGLPTVLHYMADLRKAAAPGVGYSEAFAAQILNQQLFFHYFPASRLESIRRIRALMELVRKENPDLILVMSPLPSYQLTGRQPIDSALVQTFRRLPLSFEDGVRQEKDLYEHLRSLAAEQGWVFVDNLAGLRSYRGKARLFNNFDYHLLPVASNIIGQAEAAAIGPGLKGRGKTVVKH
jgi:hypothetical protein